MVSWLTQRSYPNQQSCINLVQYRMALNDHFWNLVIFLLPKKTKNKKPIHFLSSSIIWQIANTLYLRIQEPLTPKTPLNYNTKQSGFFFFFTQNFFFNYYFVSSCLLKQYAQVYLSFNFKLGRTMVTSGKRSCAISSSKIMCRELYLDLNTIGETVCLKFEACGH